MHVSTPSSNKSETNTPIKNQINIEDFIPLVQSQMGSKKPAIRQLLIGWIMVLKSVPGVNLLDFLPDLMTGLFSMLSDQSDEIKEAAGETLQSFLVDIKAAPMIQLGPIVSITVNECQSNEPLQRLCALNWLLELMDLGKTKLVNYYSDIMKSILFCVSDAEKDIRDVASEANRALLSLIKETEIPFPLKPLLSTLTSEIMSEYISNRIAALNWIFMLYKKKSNEIIKQAEHLLPALLKTLSDPSDEVMSVALEVLANICTDKDHYSRVLRSLVQLFVEDRILLESRGPLIIRKLCFRDIPILKQQM